MHRVICNTSGRIHENPSCIKKNQLSITAHSRRLCSNIGEINVGHPVYSLCYALQTCTGRLDNLSLPRPTRHYII